MTVQYLTHLKDALLQILCNPIYHYTYLLNVGQTAQDLEQNLLVGMRDPYVLQEYFGILR